MRTTFRTVYILVVHLLLDARVMLIASKKINFLELFKILQEDEKKPSSKIKTPSSSANINTLGKDLSLHVLDPRDEELNIFGVPWTEQKTPEKVAQNFNKKLEGCFCSELVISCIKTVLKETETWDYHNKHSHIYWNTWDWSLKRFFCNEPIETWVKDLHSVLNQDGIHLMVTLLSKYS